MQYEVKVLTPVLVGDGDRLSPIDYMVWKDQVNVLDQKRIFKLLSKGPRFDGYLQQLLRSEKLDFASWGGFAQNYAGRRIAFESAGVGQIIERTRAEFCHIPTFANSPSGHYLPATALKGALRTAVLHRLWAERQEKIHAQTLEQLNSDRPPRRPAEQQEERSLGSGGTNRLRALKLADSRPVSVNDFRVFLVRTSTLVGRGQSLELGWKNAGAGAVDDRRRDDAAAFFCEMASPGAKFTGDAWEPGFLSSDEVRPELRWRDPYTAAWQIEAANQWAESVLKLQAAYAERAKLVSLQQSVAGLLRHLEQVRQQPNRCLLCIGWGGGLIGKVANGESESENARKIFGKLPYYARAVASGLPFPKTRRIVFAGNKPAALPGWVEFGVHT
ncbi:MAG: type III-A CRISPR-associated RAMP protein Csm5 [Bryobacteraceae bacterium]|nr:type III-A CRISPR-associated RAMP protein Csm5 [Bryobacteraceae bacterium]